VLVHRLAQPIDPWVIADAIVSHIHKDNLKVLVGAILLLGDKGKVEELAQDRGDIRIIWFMANFATTCLRVRRFGRLTLGRKVRQVVAS
jgi:hypothetical protein